MSGQLDGKELERRVQAYAPTISSTLARARFIRAAVVLGKRLEIHGLGKLGELAGMHGVGSKQRVNDYGTARRMLTHLISSGIVTEAEREGCYVHEMRVRIPDKRYVIRLNPDLLI
jgi:hypothetical protein